jgi:hypothetical protein
MLKKFEIKHCVCGNIIIKKFQNIENYIQTVIFIAREKTELTKRYTLAEHPVGKVRGKWNSFIFTEHKTSCEKRRPG